MANTDVGGDDADRPLDPATERLRRKMVRLLVVSVAAMLIGVMAVLAAVVYKIGLDRPARASNQPIPIRLPGGSQIEDIALDGAQAFLRLRTGDQESFVRVDLADGRIIARYEVERQ